MSRSATCLNQSEKGSSEAAFEAYPADPPPARPRPPYHRQDKSQGLSGVERDPQGLGLSPLTVPPIRKMPGCFRIVAPIPHIWGVCVQRVWKHGQRVAGARPPPNGIANQLSIARNGGSGEIPVGLSLEAIPLGAGRRACTKHGILISFLCTRSGSA